MANKSAMPLLLLAGGAALMMSGGKKKSRTKGNGNGASNADEDQRWVEVNFPSEYSEAGSSTKLVLDQECAALAEKLDMSKHNAWVTSRYNQLVAEGATSPEDLTLKMLGEQSDHCPWDNMAAWTPLMRGLYDQLLAAVKVYHQASGPAN